jgi:hypothetical protein
MSSREKGDQHFSDDIVVADDNLPDLHLQTVENFLKSLGLHQIPFRLIE